MPNESPLTITPLMRAARTGDAARCRALIADGARVDAVDAAGWTALMHACSKGHLPVVELLLEHQAAVGPCAFDGVTALLAAVAGRHAAVVDRLLTAGASPSNDVLKIRGASRWNAMRLAACNGDDATLGVLARAGARARDEHAVLYVAARVAAEGGRLRLHTEGRTEYTFLGEDYTDYPDLYVVEPPGALPARIPPVLAAVARRHEHGLSVADGVAEFVAAGFEQGGAQPEPTPHHVRLEDWRTIGFSLALQDVLCDGTAAGLGPLLWLCAGSGRVELVRALIERGAVPGDGYDPVAYASSEHHEDVVALLAEHLGLRNEALCRAAFHRDALTVERLLAAGADATAVVEDGNALVHTLRTNVSRLALGKPRVDVVRLLLAAGASPGSLWRHTRPVIVTAASEGDLDVLGLLLDAGADPNDADRQDGWTPLHVAVAANKPGVVDRLLAAGARPDALTRDGRTPLLVAAGNLAQLDARMAGALVAAGAALETRDAENRTPLLLALETHANQPLIELLIERGADVSLRDHEERTTVMMAVEVGMSEVIPILVHAGAPLDAVDREGNTALMRACRRRRDFLAVAQLLECGADTGIRNAAGQSARQIAVDAESEYPVRLLTERGAPL